MVFFIQPQRFKIGDVVNGIDKDKLRPFQLLTLKNQSSEECINCEVATGCAWCTGYNYDCADSNTLFQRVTHICKMHKANVRANIYFWEEFENKTGLESLRSEYSKKRMTNNPKLDKNKYLFFIMEDEITPHCYYKNWHKTNNRMSRSTFEEGLNYAEKNHLIPVFHGNTNGWVFLLT